MAQCYSEQWVKNVIFLILIDLIHSISFAFNPFLTVFIFFRSDSMHFSKLNITASMYSAHFSKDHILK